MSTSCPRLGGLAAAITLPLAVLACSGSAVKGGPFTGDPANFSYELDGTKVTLKAGMFEERTGDKPDDVIATDLTGNRLDADFDGDSSTDCAVVVTRDDGPIKVHYLAVIPNGSSSAMTLALGRNVLVKNLEPDPKGGLVVTLLTRPKDVPEGDAPTVEVKQTFAVKDGKLVLTGKSRDPENAPAPPPSASADAPPAGPQN